MDDWLSVFVNDKIDWNILQAVRIVGRIGTFRGAAVHSGMSINTLRGRVARAEHLAQRPIFTRSLEGVSPTLEGDVLLGRIEAMARALADSLPH